MIRIKKEILKKVGGSFVSMELYYSAFQSIHWGLSDKELKSINETILEFEKFGFSEKNIIEELVNKIEFGKTILSFIENYSE